MSKRLQTMQTEEAVPPNKEKVATSANPSDINDPITVMEVAAKRSWADLAYIPKPKRGRPKKKNPIDPGSV